MIGENKVRAIVRDEIHKQQVGGDRSIWYDAMRHTDVEFRYWDQIIGSMQPKSLFPLQQTLVYFYELVRSHQPGGVNYESKEDG